MLNATIPKAAKCYERADRARERARHAMNEAERQEFLEAEKRWIRLAHSYEFLASLSTFINDMPHNKMKNPRCPTCTVSMWLTGVVRVGDGADKELRKYQCKVCDTEVMLPGAPEA